MPHAFIAELIKDWFSVRPPVSSDRELVRCFDPETSSLICDRLAETGVGFDVHLDTVDGEPEMAAVAGWARGAIDYLPVAVRDADPEAGTTARMRGDVCRLRDHFHTGAAERTRVLLMFDNLPTETQASATSARLHAALITRSIYSEELPVLVEGLDPLLHIPVHKIMTWWSSKAAAETSPIDDAERVFAFLDSLRCAGPSLSQAVGEAITELTLVFRDPELISPRVQDPGERLERNAKIADFLERARVRWTVDPIAEARKKLALGRPGEGFFDRIVAGLESHDSRIVEANVDYPEIEKRLKEDRDKPVQLLVERVAFSADGELYPHMILNESPTHQSTMEAELVVSSPGASVQLQADADGVLDSYASLDGGPRVLLQPGASSWELSRSSDHGSGHELAIYDGPRSRRPHQVLRFMLIDHPQPATVQDARLAPEADSFLLPEAADRVVVDVGSVSLSFSPEDLGLTQPEDEDVVGEACEVELDKVEPPLRIRLQVEDRPVPASSRKTIRLMEEAGWNDVGNGSQSRVRLGDHGGIEVYATSTYRLHGATRDEIAMETAWLVDPQRTHATPDSTASAHRVLGAISAFPPWLAAREELFDAVRRQSSAALGTNEVASMHLLQWTNDVQPSIARYLDCSIAMYEGATSRLASSDNPEVSEAILLADAIVGDGTLEFLPSSVLSLALLGCLRAEVLGTLPAGAPAREVASLQALLGRPLLAGVLPWIQRDGLRHVADTGRDVPLLWRRYASPNAAHASTGAEFADVIRSKVERLLALAPHLNSPSQLLRLRFEGLVGESPFVTAALVELCKLDGVRCRFDVGVPHTGVDLVKLFARRVEPDREEDRARLSNRVQVAVRDPDRAEAAHLRFCMGTVPGVSSAAPVLKEVETHDLRETGFSAGLSQEPLRVAELRDREVEYRRYVHASVNGCQKAAGLWGGPWRARFLRLSQLSRQLLLGAVSPVRTTSLPALSLRQRLPTTADERALLDSGHAQSFLTVYCNPDQGPELFVGTRTAAGVFLVECTDRGDAELPGRDVVAVTSRIRAFRAALTESLGVVRSVASAIDDEAAGFLLRDINALRGTDLYAFLREAAHENARRQGVAGALGDVLGLRFMLQPGQLPADGSLPVVVSTRDLAARSPLLKPLLRRRRGARSDDLVVFYLPPAPDDHGVWTIKARVVEVKLAGNDHVRKGIDQVTETATTLRREVFPSGPFSQEAEKPSLLLLERDLGWIINESIERYRSYDFFSNTDIAAVNSQWALTELSSAMHRGDFKLELWDSRVLGTVLELRLDQEGDRVSRTTQGLVEVLSIPRVLVEELLAHPVSPISPPTRPSEPPPMNPEGGVDVPWGGRAGGGDAPEDQDATALGESPAELVLPLRPTAERQRASSTPSEPAEVAAPQDSAADSSGPKNAATPENRATRRHGINLQRRYSLILATLREYGVRVAAVDDDPVREGPAFYSVRIRPELGVRPADIMKRTDELKLRLELDAHHQARSLIDQGAVVFEIPKKDDERYFVDAEEMWERATWPEGELWAPIGEDIQGDIVGISFSSSDSPHLLIAGTTGGGKSVALDTILRGLCMRWAPERLELCLVDGKGTELQDFEDSPHLSGRIGYQPEDAAEILEACVDEMQARLLRFREVSARGLLDFNERVAPEERIPWRVVVLDEYADLTADKDDRKSIERLLQRLAQKARSAGIHLIVSTQKPSAEVISTTIRSNMPAQLALRVKTSTDSKIILDETGAESLAGKGDAFLRTVRGMVRVQCAVVRGG